MGSPVRTLDVGTRRSGGFAWNVERSRAAPPASARERGRAEAPSPAQGARLERARGAPLTNLDVSRTATPRVLAASSWCAPCTT